MLRLALQTAQAGMIALILYNAFTALWGWNDRRAARPGDRQRRLRVVVPAHNEEAVVGRILTDLARDHYEHKEVWVLADRCEDATASVARSFGALVAERSKGPDGKGAALAWYLGQHPLAPNEALVVFDADNRTEPTTLTRIADELDDGHLAVQCYLDVDDAEDSLIAEASALSYWASNRMVQLARSNLGWSADLGGTGMALTDDALALVGGFSNSMTEDQDLGVQLLLAGERVEWLHDIRVLDQKPKSIGVAVRQRARWMAGKRATRRKYLLPLLRSGRLAAIDQAIRLLQPGRVFIALVSGGLTLTSVFAPSWLFPWQLWASMTAIQFLQPIPFLAKEGIPWKVLLRYPVIAVLGVLWIPIRLASSRISGWYHTPHD